MRSSHARSTRPRDVNSSILYIEVSLFVHATEDPEKCIKAVREIFPFIFEQGIIFTKDTMEGHYDNPIILMKTIVRNPITKTLIHNLSKQLELDDKKKLLAEIENHINGKKILYLRFDKQEAYLGNLKIGQSDPVHVKIKLQGKSLDTDEVNQLLGLL